MIDCLELRKRLHNAVLSRSSQGCMGKTNQEAAGASSVFSAVVSGAASDFCSAVFSSFGASAPPAAAAGSASPPSDDVQRVRLSRSSCMIKVLSR